MTSNDAKYEFIVRVLSMEEPNIHDVDHLKSLVSQDDISVPIFIEYVNTLLYNAQTNGSLYERIHAIASEILRDTQIVSESEFLITFFTIGMSNPPLIL